MFQRPASGWTNATQTAELTASDGVANDRFGSSVAIAGATAVVSSPVHAVGATQGAGTVYVFQRPETGWANGAQTAELQASDGTANLALGSAVSVSADASTIAAGARGYGGNTGPTPFTGAVYVFVRPPGGWASGTQTAELTASDAGGSASLGSTVAISADGNTIVAGAPGYTAAPACRRELSSCSSSRAPCGAARQTRRPCSQRRTVGSAAGSERRWR